MFPGKQDTVSTVYIIHDTRVSILSLGIQPCLLTLGIAVACTAQSAPVVCLDPRQHSSCEIYHTEMPWICYVFEFELIFGLYKVRNLSMFSNV